MMMRTSVRIIVLLTITLLFSYLWVHYKSSTQTEGTWLYNDLKLSHAVAKSDDYLKFNHIVNNKLSINSHYSNHILNHEFPDCQDRTIYNGYAKYSLPDIVRFIRQYIPPPSGFIGHLKNPCWFANYDKIKSDLNLYYNYSRITHQDYSYLLPKTSGTKTLYCLPYMYLLGYPKCGTTSLYEYFRKHPEFATFSSRGCGWIGVHTSGLIKKYPANVKTVFSLLNHFYLASRQIEKSSADDHVNDKIIADFSPGSSWRQSGFEQFKNGSMCDPPLLLRELQPDAKFVVLLREPINRLYSAFWFYAGNKYQKKLSPEIFIGDVQTFFKRLKLCDSKKSMLKCLREAQDFDNHFKDFRHMTKNEQLLTGFYYLYLLPWLQVFPRENFLFIRTEDMKKDTGKTLQEIFQFLGMSHLSDKKIDEIQQIVRHEQTLLHSNSEMLLSSPIKKQLRAYFRPFNERLAELLNDDKFLWDDIE